MGSAHPNRAAATVVNPALFCVARVADASSTVVWIVRENISNCTSRIASIEKKRGLMLKEWEGQIPFEEKSAAMIDAMLGSKETDRMTARTFEFADFLVQVGYRESDTVANGMLYYREALKHYLLPLKPLGRFYHRNHSYIEDRAILMMIILGGDESHTKAWFTESGSNRAINYVPSSYFQILGCERTDDQPFQALLLLSHLKLTKVYEDNINRLKAFSETIRAEHSAIHDVVANNIRPFLVDQNFLDAAPDSNVLMAISQMPDQADLIPHLRDTIPLRPCHAPCLFSYDIDHQPLPELWMIYQDCFFENDLIQYLPDWRLGLYEDSDNEDEWDSDEEYEDSEEDESVDDSETDYVVE